MISLVLPRFCHICRVTAGTAEITVNNLLMKECGIGFISQDHACLRRCGEIRLAIEENERKDLLFGYKEAPFPSSVRLQSLSFSPASKTSLKNKALEPFDPS